MAALGGARMVVLVETSTLRSHFSMEGFERMWSVNHVVAASTICFAWRCGSGVRLSGSLRNANRASSINAPWKTGVLKLSGSRKSGSIVRASVVSRRRRFEWYAQIASFADGRREQARHCTEVKHGKVRRASEGASPSVRVAGRENPERARHADGRFLRSETGAQRPPTTAKNSQLILTRGFTGNGSNCCSP